MFHFTLVSLTGIQFDEEVHEVILPTLDGEIGVLSHHMPLISVVKNGAIAVRREPKTKNQDRDFFACSGGVIDVKNNSLKVLVDEADHADGINEAEAQEAFERAQKMHAEAKDQVSLEHAQALMDRTATRLQVAGLKRRRHRS